MGPIRPPSEAYSILLRITRNCPWNKCSFCPVYKGEKFSLRTVDEIKSDIDAISSIADLITEKTEKYRNTPYHGQKIFSEISSDYNIDQSNVHQVAFWLNSGMKSLFLQDADSMVVKPDRLVEILNHIKKKIPSVQRITAYGRSKTTSNRSVEDLKSIRKAGLNRIHIGMESGSEKVLKILNKGVTPEEQISAGQKIREAGFELSEYFMPGSGGKEFSEENAVESARVINAINPTFTRIRTTTPIPNTPLFQMMQDKKWIPVSEEGRVREIRLFIEKLENITSVLTSDHMMNLLEDVEGEFPDGKKNMLETIDAFLSMSEMEKELFIIGRRLGRFRYLSDFRVDPEIEKIRTDLLERFPSIDEAVVVLSRNFV